MLITPNLPAWQYAGYSENHANRLNLILHIITAPIFMTCMLGTVYFLLRMAWVNAAVSFGIVLLVVIQGIGHGREDKKPEPFLSPLDFLARFITENFFTFWRFVVSGKWFTALNKTQ